MSEEALDAGAVGVTLSAEDAKFASTFEAAEARLISFGAVAEVTGAGVATSLTQPLLKVDADYKAALDRQGGHLTGLAADAKVAGEAVAAGITGPLNKASGEIKTALTKAEGHMAGTKTAAKAAGQGIADGITGPLAKAGQKFSTLKSQAKVAGTGIAAHLTNGLGKVDSKYGASAESIEAALKSMKGTAEGAGRAAAAGLVSPLDVVVSKYNAVSSRAMAGFAGLKARAKIIGAGVATGLTERLARVPSKFKSILDRASGRMMGLKARAVAAGKGMAEGLTAPLRKAEARISGVLGRIGGKLDKFGGKARAIGMGMSIGITAPITAAAGLALGAAGSIESMEVGFTAMLGSADAAGKLVADLNTFAANTPNQLKDIAGATRQLLASGTGLDAIPNTLKFLGDVAAGAQVPIGDLAQIFSKMQNKGKAQAEELNQMAERGIPIIAMLAKQYGITKAEVFKMGEQGKITAESVKAALKGMAAEGGIFANMMMKQSKTLFGLLSTTKDNVFLLAASIGDDLLPLAKDFLGGMIKGLQSAAEWYRGLSTETQVLVGVLAALAAAAGPFLIGLGAIAAAIPLVAAGVSAFVGAIPAILGVAAAVAVVGVAAWNLRSMFAGAKEAVLGFVGDAIGFFQNLRENVGIITTWFGENWRIMLSDLGANVGIAARNVLRIFAAMWRTQMRLITAFLGWGAARIQDFFLSKLPNSAADGFAAVLTKAASFGKSLMKIMKNALSGDGFSLKSMTDALQTNAFSAGFIEDDFGKTVKGILAKGKDELGASLESFQNNTGALELNLTRKAGDEDETAKKAGEAAAGGVVKALEPLKKFAGAAEAGSAEAFRAANNLLKEEDDKALGVANKQLVAQEKQAEHGAKIVALLAAKDTAKAEVLSPPSFTEVPLVFPDMPEPVAPMIALPPVTPKPEAKPKTDSFLHTAVAALTGRGDIVRANLAKEIVALKGAVDTQLGANASAVEGVTMTAPEPRTGSNANTDHLKELVNIAKEELEAVREATLAAFSTTSAVNELRDKIQVKGVA